MMLVDFFTRRRVRRALFEAGSFQLLRIDRAFHQVAGAEHAQAFEVASAGLVRHLLRDVQPGTRRSRLDPIKGLMDGVVGADQEIGSRPGQLVSRREHQVGNSLPIAGINATHVPGQGMSMHRDFRVIVRSHQVPAFERDGAIAQRRSLRAASHNADVLGHGIFVR